MAKSTCTWLLPALALLTLAAGLIFNSGIVKVRNAVSLYVALPVGAVFLGLFLISRLLQNESELHDRELHKVGDPPSVENLLIRLLRTSSLVLELDCSGSYPVILNGVLARWT